MNKVIILTATFSYQTREVVVVVDVLTDGTPQPIKGSRKSNYFFRLKTKETKLMKRTLTVPNR